MMEVLVTMLYSQTVTASLKHGGMGTAKAGPGVKR